MSKAAITCLIFLAVNISMANSAERWECALDLQQGDRGSMTLERSGTSINGNINIDRNGSNFSQEVEGRWADQEIELKRFVNTSSNQSMHGVAIRVEDGRSIRGGFERGLECRL